MIINFFEQIWNFIFRAYNISHKKNLSELSAASTSSMSFFSSPLADFIGPADFFSNRGKFYTACVPIMRLSKCNDQLCFAMQTLHVFSLLAAF